MDRSLLCVVTGAVLLFVPLSCSGADETAGSDESREQGTSADDGTATVSDALSFQVPRFFRFRHPRVIRGSGGATVQPPSAGGAASGSGGAGTQPPSAGGATTQPPGTGGAAQPPPGTGGASTQPPSGGDPFAGARTPDGRAIPLSSLPGGGCPPVVVAVGFWSCVTVGDKCSFTAAGVTHHCDCQGGGGEGQAPVWNCD
jgi:hypothetical protein